MSKISKFTLGYSRSELASRLKSYTRQAVKDHLSKVGEQSAVLLKRELNIDESALRDLIAEGLIEVKAQTKGLRTIALKAS